MQLILSFYAPTEAESQQLQMVIGRCTCILFSCFKVKVKQTIIRLPICVHIMFV